MTPLNSLTFPLTGPSLIEASAGTGKTYTIVNLYLRLLLGHGCEAKSVEQILVVTFTNAATAELKDRIRERLNLAYLAFFAGSSDDAFLQQLIDDSEDRQNAMLRLSLASRQMDEASVFTIHSFCQRMLAQHAFESGVMYEQTLIMDQSEWLQMAVQDYWRTHIVTQPNGILSQLLAIWPAPQALQYHVQPLISRAAMMKQSVSVEQCHKQFAALQQQVLETKQWWLAQDIGNQLLNAKLKANTRLGKADTYHYMEAFCRSDNLIPQIGKEGWNAFNHEKVSKAKSKSSTDLSHIDFDRFSQLQAQVQEALDSLYLAYSAHALACIRRNLEQNKSLHNLLAPDDLLARLRDSLQGQQGKSLANAIAESHPAVLIDEFQDTDPIQFDIFRTIYAPTGANRALCWIMIGDPKQAIYAFRGADIFTYIDAKHLVPHDHHFTLAKNWRSQANLVNAVNRLFEQSEMGFMFENSIPFYPVDAAKKEEPLSHDSGCLPSLEFQFLASSQGGPVSWDKAQSALAAQTTNQITTLLNNRTQVAGRQLGAGDCCVLVRDRAEAEIIKNSLQQAGIASVFLIRRSVFSTPIATDLLRLLSALANPADERQIRAALATELFGFDALQLDRLLSDDVEWQNLVEQVYQWHLEWQSAGLMKAVNLVCQHFGLPKKLVAQYADGSRRLTDLRHLTELLQQQSALISGQTQLLHWFAERILDPDHDHEGQQLRLETDENLVQIVTMHASKGLEFPVVFIPFACRYRAAKVALYHDQDQSLTLDYLAHPDSLAIAEKERLAEDIRLLYVALTRAVYYCSVGIWNNSHTRLKKQSEITQTALGRLLLRSEQQIDDQSILSAIEALAMEADIGVNQVPEQQPIEVYTADKETEKPALVLNSPSQRITRSWRLTSYSAISQHQQDTELEKPGLDEGPSSIDNVEQHSGLLSLARDRYSFVKGAQAGSFLHGVLENIDLNNPTNLEDVISQQGQWFGIEEVWYDTVHDWVIDLLKTPIDSAEPGDCFTLHGLTPDKVKVEMEFHLPLHHIAVQDFNLLVNRFFPQQQRHYQFDELNGMLKGFIDLTFEYSGKYYVADYKSNHLGDNIQSYQPSALEHAMQEHDYHLQSILYTLALHRWLKLILSDYDYERHIGGAYYLFLRGMEHDKVNSGVYYLKPQRSLIEQLDTLFQTGKLIDTTADNKQQTQLDLW